MLWLTLLLLFPLLPPRFAQAGTAPDPLAGVRRALPHPEQPFTLVVDFTLRPGADVRARFREMAARVIAGTLREAGVVLYEFHYACDEPQRVMVFEKWRNLAALESHFREAHTESFISETAALLAEPPLLRVMRGQEAQS